MLSPISSARSPCRFGSCRLTDKGQHAFEDVRVREEERSIRDCHDLEFGSRLHAVFRRARGVLRLDENRTWAEFDRCWEDRNVFGR